MIKSKQIKMTIAASLLSICMGMTSYAATVNEAVGDQITRELYQKVLEYGNREDATVTETIRNNVNSPLSVDLNGWDLKNSTANLEQLTECIRNLDYQYLCSGMFQPVMRTMNGKYEQIGVYPQYPMDLSREKVVRDKIAELGESLKRNTENETIAAIHQYILDHCSYDYTGAEENNTTYGCLIKGVAQCHGYSATFVRLCQATGLEAEEVVGTVHKSDGSVRPHAWCRVRLNGEWKYFDPTWNDVYNPADPNHYYMLDEAAISTDHFMTKTYVMH